MACFTRHSGAMRQHRTRNLEIPDSRFANSGMTTSSSLASEPGELLHHPLIDRPLERDDQLRKVLHRLPTPVDELRLVAAAAGIGDVDLAVLAGEARREPFLPLAPIAALPGPPRHGARDVVDQPVRDLAELLERADAGLLIKLALGRVPGVLAGIDAALRHLPDMVVVDMLDAAGAPADEDEPVAVEQHHADTGPVGQIFVARHSVGTPGHQAGKAKGALHIPAG